MPSRVLTGAALLLLFAVPFLPLGKAQQGFYPVAIPLAVRSPYLSCWLPLSNGTAWDRTLPTTSDLSQDLGWSVLVHVDSLTYRFLGAPEEPFVNVNVTNMVVTPTQTVISAQAGPMQVDLTFLNPIEPGDRVKQSIPFSYLSFTAISTDNSAHKVQVYSDVTGEWMSGDRSQHIQWNVTSNTDVIYHTVTLQNPDLFSEVGAQAEWGTLYYAMKTGSGISYKISNDTTSRRLFDTGGALDNQINATFGPISDNPVFAISCDLGTIQITPAPVVWAIGYTTDPAISYTDQSGSPPETRSLYYKLQYSDDASLIFDFLNDFSNAFSRANQLDLKILQDAASVSNLLGDLVSTAVAQVYGSTQLTVGIDTSGNFNTSDVMMFMKNIGGAVANLVNPVETLYAAFPAFMYIDPNLGVPLLDPLFRLQAHANYGISYAAADLGSNYPNVTGIKSVHNQEIEQSGNMLIMAYAHARATGDGSLISRYYRVLTSWADYLVNTLLFIHDQSSADGLSVSNQTNLAIKGIIGIQAMSKMCSILGQVTEANNYSTTAAQLYGQWKSIALGNDQHVLAVYGQPASWTLGYNLFADIWLDTNLIESSIYDSQSSFINNLLLDPDINAFGLPVDSLSSSTPITVSSWNLFVAGMTSDNDQRSNFIERIYNRSHLLSTAGAFPLVYNSVSGSDIQGSRGSEILRVSSPAQGAMFAPLARNAPVVPIKSNTTTMTSTSKPSKTSHVGEIAGAVAGGLAILFTAIGVLAFMRCRRRRKTRKFVGPSSAGARIETKSQMRATPSNLTPPRTTRWEPVRRVVFRDSQPRTPDPVQVARATTGNAHESRPALPAQRLSTPSLSFIPVGLSAKELARLRAETLPSAPLEALQDPQSGQSEGVAVVTNVHEPPLAPLTPRRRPPSPSMSSAPIGLSAKELARLRAETLRTQQIPVHNESIEPQFEPVTVTVPVVSTVSTDSESEQDAAIPPPENRELRTVVESLQREVQRLRAERFDAPPSYTEGRT